MKSHSLFIVTAVILLITSVCTAQIPRTMSYQGILADTLGNPKPDGSYAITFRLYDVASGGTALWTEVKTLMTKRGLFSTVLGEQVSLNASVRFDKSYWLGIQVAADPELSPRIPLTSVGYSLNSARADTAGFAITAPAQAFVDSARIARTIPDGEITSAKIADGTIQRADVQPSFKAPFSDTSDYARHIPPVSICDSARIAGMVPNNSITSAKILDGTIQRVDVATNFTAPYADTATYARSAPQSAFVDSARITGTVPDNSIISSKIMDGTIQRVDVQPSFKAPYADTADAVRTIPPVSVADSARIAGTIPNNSVTSAKIADGTIQRADVQSKFKAPYSDTSDYAKAATPSGSAAGDLTGTFPNPTIANNAVTSSKILDGTIQRADVQPSFTAPFSDTADYARTTGTATSSSTLVPGANITGSVYDGPVVQVTNNDSSAGGGYALSAQNYSHFTWRPAIYGENKGLSAGVFGRADNWHAVVGWNQSNTSAGVWGKNVGRGYGLRGESDHGTGVYGSSSGDSAAVYGYNNGTGRGGLFQMNNTSNNSVALEASTNGFGGEAMYGHADGSGGGAGWFDITNTSNSADAVWGLTQGIGPAGYFEIGNSTNSNPAIIGNTDGTGHAGLFYVANSSSGNSALLADHTGSGVAVHGYNEGTGKGGLFQIKNASNSSVALEALTDGTGDVFYAHTSTATNSVHVVSGTANGNGVYSEANNGINAWGVYGASTDGIGLYGYSSTGMAVRCNGWFYQDNGIFEAHPSSTVWTTNKPATVKLNDGSKVKLFTEESAELYFTDYGEGTLSSGRTHIELDPTFLQTVTVDSKHSMKVFVQLEDDCNGVYVANKSRSGFDVVELHGGTSSAHFSYRVVCKRKYYEDERLATEEQDIRFNTTMLEKVWPEVKARHQEEQTKMKLIEEQTKRIRPLEQSQNLNGLRHGNGNHR